MFKIKVMTDTGNGMKLLITIAKAVPLPTDTWLGSIKKNTAVDTINVPIVMMKNSLILRLLIISTSVYLFSKTAQFFPLSGSHAGQE